MLPAKKPPILHFINWKLCRVIPRKTLFQQSRSFRSKFPRKIWTKEEESRLLEARNRGESWKQMTSSFPGRSAAALQNHYSHYLETSPSHVRWNEEDTARLFELRKSGKTWKQINAAMPERTMASLVNQYLRHDVPRQKLVKWSEEEDAQMLEWKAAGETWNTIAARMPGRTRKALVKRYGDIGPRGKRNQLLHARTHAGTVGAFSDETHDKILELHEEGMSFKEIHAVVCPDVSIKRVKRLLFDHLGQSSYMRAARSRSRSAWSRSEDKTVLRMRHEEHKYINSISLFAMK